MSAGRHGRRGGAMPQYAPMWALQDAPRCAQIDEQAGEDEQTKKGVLGEA